MRIHLVIFILLLSGCVTKRASEIIPADVACEGQLEQARSEDIEIKLSSLSVLFSRGCYQEVVVLGSEIRTSNRDKYYSIVNEAKEVVTYEGVSTDYTLDSHERIFLGTLMSVSYLKLGKKESAEIELNRAYDESTAQIYRSGNDEVNIFLQGLMWLQLSGWDKAEPFFHKIESFPESSPHLKLFIKKLSSMPKKNNTFTNLQVYTMNHMPEVRFDWFSSYSKKYDPKLSVKNCLSENSIILTTSPWIKQIENREHYEGDTVLTAKRMIRLPATILYSASVLLVGGALTYVAADTQLAPYLAALTIVFTVRTFVNGLAPDMRVWRDLPEAFYISLGEPNPTRNICMKKYPLDIYKVEEFFKFKLGSRG